MPVPGRRPKPDGMKRNRVKPTYEWTDVADVPFAGAPALPRTPPRIKGSRPPAPLRPLGPHGLRLWNESWADGRAALVDDTEFVQQLCELVDERVALRSRVLRDDDAQGRNQLRLLDRLVASGLARLAKAGMRPPSTWPARTRSWWHEISTMPHCALWRGPDWEFAIDTAVIAAAFHAGDLRLGGELRARERLLGNSADARRDLRIRYVDDTGTEVIDQASVTAMDDYRKMAAG